MLLKELTAAFGVSGCEQEIRTLLRRLCQERGATCSVDRIGNLVAQKSGGDTRAPHVLLAAHMDEVGLIVRGAHEEGYLRYAPVGGVDPRVLVSKTVLCGEKRIPGVIGAKAIHLQSAEDKRRVLGHNDLYIDIGAKSGEEALKLCPAGTYVVFDSPLEPMGDNCVVSRALDDRVGCLALLHALEHGYCGELTCVFTSMEEVGLRGARVAGQHLTYDLAVVVEGTTCNDLGDVPSEAQVCNLGKGVAISFSDRASIAHPRLRAAMETLAREKGIPAQPKRASTGGNDAGALQTAAGAKPTVVLSVPCRYIHSPASVASLSDIQAQSDLVCAFLDALPALKADIFD